MHLPPSVGICCVQAGVAKRKKEVRPVDARKIAARMARQGEAVLWLLNVVNSTAVICVPSFTVRRTRAEPIPAFVLMLVTIILWMKLISFWHCNLTLRCAMNSRITLAALLTASWTGHKHLC